MAKADVQLVGLKKLQRKLDRLKQSTRNKVVRPAVAAALSPINKSAKQNAPVRTGLLKKSIGSKVKTYARYGVVWGAVGPRFEIGGTITQLLARGQSKATTKTLVRLAESQTPGVLRGYDQQIIPALYAHLVEFGTHRTAAKPFLRPAMEANRVRVSYILSTKIKAGLEREARRG